ncbi:MAG: ABC transporter substrate-binding protein [Actinomycetales bacterium]|nr:ABC transporter substrate-binding protein [Actinomycetales bacterium]
MGKDMPALAFLGRVNREESSVIKRVLTKGLGVTLGLSLIAVGAAGQAQAADPGISKDKVVIGTTTPLTGIASPGYKDVSAAAKAYFDYVNANGGINGRQIEFVIKDDQYNPAATVTATNELINQNKVFSLFGALGTANRLAVEETLKAQNVPDVFINSGSSVFDNPSKYPGVFPFFPSYLVEAKVMASYIQSTAELKDLKRCLFYQEGEFGENAGAGFAAAGMTFAAQTSYTTAQLVSRNLAPQVTTLKAAGCQLVVFFGVTSATGLLLGTSAALKFQPKWMVTSVGSEPSIIGGLLAQSKLDGKALMNGMYTPSFLTPITDVGNPYVSLMKPIVEGAGLPWNFYTYYGVNSAYVFAQALKAAGPNLSRKALINALQTQSASFKSAANVPMRITDKSHQGLLGYWMGQYDSAGTLVRQTKGILIAGNSTTSGKVINATFKPAKAPAKLLP